VNGGYVRTFQPILPCAPVEQLPIIDRIDSDLLISITGRGRFTFSYRGRYRLLIATPGAVICEMRSSLDDGTREIDTKNRQ